MIISKDLFIFGEQIFATIIPESGSSQNVQQQQQHQTAAHQRQLQPQEQPYQLAIINTTTVAETEIATAPATQITSALNSVGASTPRTTETNTVRGTEGAGTTAVLVTTATTVGTLVPDTVVDTNTGTKLQKIPKEVDVELKQTQYQQQQSHQQQIQQIRARRKESKQIGPRAQDEGENGYITNKINVTNLANQQKQPNALATRFATAKATLKNTVVTETRAEPAATATAARFPSTLPVSVIVEVDEDDNGEKEPLVKKNCKKIKITPTPLTASAIAGTGDIRISINTTTIETIPTNNSTTKEVKPLLHTEYTAEKVIELQQQLTSTQPLTTTDYQYQLQSPLSMSLSLSEEGGEAPSAFTTSTIVANSERNSFDTTAVDQRLPERCLNLNSNEDLPSLTTTTTTAAMSKSQQYKGNNTSDQTMSTFPFLTDGEPHHRTLQLSFQNLEVLHNDRQILCDVSGLVSPGEVLAVMGPSGSGKTTLLDCLSGQRRFDSGGVYLNREQLSKKWRRKICYVLQEEIFFSGLTLRETIMYTALLRLPEAMSKIEKIKSVDRILEALELTFCQHTKFGDYLNRGLSGGEKKRANIACELLTNPLLMLLDEPTSGLDSHSAISLMKFLKRYAVQEQKTVVITVHQPSSQMFHMFDKLLLLCNGQTAYFGEVNNIYTYFESIGVTIKPHYNPADFVLEQLKSYPDIREKLFIAARESHGNYLNRNCIAVNTNNQPNQQHHANNYHHRHLRDLQHHSSHNGIGFCTRNGDTVTPTSPITTTTQIVNEKPNKHDTLINNIINNYYKDIHNNHHNHNHHNNPNAMLIINEHPNSNEEASQQLWYGHDSQSNSSATSSDCQQYESCGDSDWLDYPTSFHTQFCVLSSRNFKEAKPRMLSKLNWFQTVGLALMAGSIWFQIPRTEEFLHDLQGWMFFSQTYWMLFALFGALNSFPAEREVISKERRSGAYRLSAYYLAKMFGELPLVVTLPTVYLMISYPMLGCTSFKLFFLMLVFLLLNTIVAQSVGFFIGACCMDMNVSITLSALYTLATQLFGGYLSTRIPNGLSWIRYTSMIHYAYQNMQILEFREGPAIRCGNPSSFETCKIDNTTSMFIPYEEILKAQNSTSPLWLNTLVLMMFFVVFRALGYVVLRYVRCPKT